MKFKVRATGEVVSVAENWGMVEDSGKQRTFLLCELEPHLADGIIVNDVAATKTTDRSLKEILGGQKIRIEID